MKVFEFLPEFSDVKEIKKEVKIGNSRIDFVLDNVPLERGARHVKEIIEHNGIILFLVVRKAKSFAPNWEMDPKFSNNLSEARKKGIRIIPVQISFDGKTIYFHGIIPLSDF